MIEAVDVPNEDANRMKTIPREHLNEVCRVGQRAACCKYVVCGADGFKCAKNTHLAAAINRRVNMSAKSDNCNGSTDIPWLQ